MKHRLSLALTALCALGFAATLLAACGGRALTTREADDDTGGGGAPGAGRGGSAVSHAGASSAGASGAGASSAGASNTGGSGAGNCSNVKCASIACPAGSMPIIQPGACCATACSVCAVCPKIACPSGTHYAQLPDNCCPVCIDDGGAACEMGRQAYATERQAILTKYEYGCSNASECVVSAPVNLCEQGCSYAAVWYGVADSFESNLSNAADMYCSNCKQGPIPPCAAPPKPHCINGQCAFTLK